MGGAVELTKVRELVVLMREVGATRVRMEGLEVELGPPPAPEAQSAEKPDPPESRPRCACGHDWSEHGDGGCLNGCDLARCGEPQKEPEAT
jgi:hypothetical protein